MSYWYHLNNNQPDKKMTVHHLDGVLFHGGVTNTKDAVDNVLKNRQLIVQGMIKLVAAYKARQPIYVQIHNGARAGSIAKISHKCLRLNTPVVMSPDQITKIIQQGVLTSDPHIFIRETNNNFYGIREPNKLLICMAEWVMLNTGVDIQYEFDGRKPITTNWNDQQGLEVLPDYQGPTVYQFARKESKSKAEKDAEKAAQAYSHVPLDMFGNEVAIGDMIIYARSGELVIGRLMKVSPSAYLSVETIMDKKTVSLQGTESIDSILNKRNNPALMKFNKNENLSQKLMVEKLKR